MTVALLDKDAQQGPDYAVEFAAFSAGITIDRMPEAVVEAARMNLFDTLACATAGFSAEGVADLAGVITDWGGKPEASIWCTGTRVPAHHAAWVNGMMAHARDYDDTHDGAVLHGGVSVVPAAIAAAELNPTATGADVLAGVAVGLELICRLGVAARIGPIELGFIYTSLFGHFAATAAASRVMRFTPAETVNALGIAYSQAAGTHQVTRDAALTKRMQPGFAAKTALISVAMTRIGIRGAQRTFEGIDGFFRTYLRNDYDAVALRQGLGQEFEFANLSYKPYPCCRFNHTAIDAALVLRDRLQGRKILRIMARVNRPAYEAVCTPLEMRKNPQTIVQAQFSIPYTVATALLQGSVGLSDFTSDGISRPDVLALAAKVETVVDDAIDRDWGRSISPTHLVIDTDQGTVEARIDLPRGGPDRPMSRSDFEAKLVDCLRISGRPWPAETVARFRRDIDGLATAPRGSSVIDALVLPWKS